MFIQICISSSGAVLCHGKSAATQAELSNLLNNLHSFIFSDGLVCFVMEIQAIQYTEKSRVVKIGVLF